MALWILPFVNIGPSLDGLAGDWISSYAMRPEEFRGTLTQLQAYIAQSSDNCGAYVHSENKTISTANGVATCKSKLNYLYEAKLMELEQQQKADIEGLRNWAKNNITMVYIGIAIVLIVLLLLVFL
ncbi:MAG: hypothetical protein EBX41_01985 [Chitinophagia bacterium]|nr:hypothetical protein [Chitinophagia bacterium]